MFFYCILFCFILFTLPIFLFYFIYFLFILGLFFILFFDSEQKARVFRGSFMHTMHEIYITTEYLFPRKYLVPNEMSNISVVDKQEQVNR